MMIELGKHCVLFSGASLSGMFWAAAFYLFDMRPSWELVGVMLGAAAFWFALSLLVGVAYVAMSMRRESAEMKARRP